MISQNIIIDIGKILPKAADAMQDLNFIQGKIFAFQILNDDKVSFCDTIYVDGCDLVLWLENNNLPQSLSSVWRQDKRVRNVMLYSNNEVVAKHNYKRINELNLSQEKVVCYASIVPESFRIFVEDFDL